MNEAGKKYGYYEINGIETFSRYERMDIIHQSGSNHWGDWWYNEDFFRQFDWRAEPKETLDELYGKRAIQLRKDYDYLVLYYSGGYDSANMLHAFLDNDVYPDEIAVFHSRYDTVSNQYLELRDYTWEKIAKIQKRYPQIKIRKIDYSDYFFKWDSLLKEANPTQDLIYNFGAALSINHLMTDLLHRHIYDWKQLLEQKKKVAWLHGVEKPPLRYLDGQWIFNFHDALTQLNLTPLRQIIDDGSIGNYEFFVWGRHEDCAKIIIKQCQLLKKKYHKQSRKDFSKIEGARPYIENYGWTINPMSLSFVKTIYPRLFTEDEKFFTTKTPFHIWGNRDQWFFNTQHPGSQTHWAMYRSTFDEKHKHWRKFYNDGETIDSGFINAISRDYLI